MPHSRKSTYSGNWKKKYIKSCKVVTYTAYCLKKEWDKAWLLITESKKSHFKFHGKCWHDSELTELNMNMSMF